MEDHRRTTFIQPSSTPQRSDVWPAAAAFYVIRTANKPFVRSGGFHLLTHDVDSLSSVYSQFDAVLLLPLPWLAATSAICFSKSAQQKNFKVNLRYLSLCLFSLSLPPSLPSGDGWIAAEHLRVTAPGAWHTCMSLSQGSFKLWVRVCCCCSCWWICTWQH